MDVEAVVARRISKAVGVKAFLDVPAEPDAPDTFITVEQTGGSGNFLDEVVLDIDCWALRGQRRESKALADRVRAAAIDLDAEPNIFAPHVENVYRMNDPDTDRARYVVTVLLRVCE